MRWARHSSTSPCSNRHSGRTRTFVGLGLLSLARNSLSLLPLIRHPFSAAVNEILHHVLDLLPASPSDGLTGASLQLGT